MTWSWIHVELVLVKFDDKSTLARWDKILNVLTLQLRWKWVHIGHLIKVKNSYIDVPNSNSICVEYLIVVAWSIHSSVHTNLILVRIEGKMNVPKSFSQRFLIFICPEKVSCRFIIFEKNKDIESRRQVVSFTKLNSNWVSTIVKFEISFAVWEGVRTCYSFLNWFCPNCCL